MCIGRLTTSIKTHHTGTGSNVDQKRIGVCKEELIVIETYISFNHNNNNKSYYHFTNKTILYYIYTHNLNQNLHY
jgi:hypothetical protein